MTVTRRSWPSTLPPSLSRTGLLCSGLNHRGTPPVSPHAQKTPASKPPPPARCRGPRTMPATRRAVVEWMRVSFVVAGGATSAPRQSSLESGEGGGEGKRILAKIDESRKRRTELGRSYKEPCEHDVTWFFSSGGCVRACVRAWARARHRGGWPGLTRIRKQK
jgi:hypothetical protein